MEDESTQIERDGAAEAAALDELLAIVREFDLHELHVRVGDATYDLVARESAPAIGVPGTLATPSIPQHAPAAPAAAAPPTAAANAKKVVAPIIGVFYRAPSPDADPYVELGDRVEVGQVLCILEAMKLMNEITSDYAGVVKRILPENGALVTLGEEMMWIEP